MIALHPYDRARIGPAEPSPKRKHGVRRPIACAPGSVKWRFIGHVHLALACGVWIAVLSNGCARPRGELFPPMERAVVWPAPPETPRIRFVGTLSSSKDLRASRSGVEVLKAAFRGPRPAISFTGPHSVAVGPRGLLAVADSGGGAVHVIDLRNREHRPTTD